MDRPAHRSRALNLLTKCVLLQGSGLGCMDRGPSTRRHAAGHLIIRSADHSHKALPRRREAGMSAVARVDGDHFELPVDALELLRQVRPADQQWFIEEVTQALAVAADTKDFGPLQYVLEAWTVTVRLPAATGLRGDARADTTPRAGCARGSRRAASPSPLGPCVGGSSRPRSSGKRSSAIPTPNE